jgi:hypothetical protein
MLDDSRSFGPALLDGVVRAPAVDDEYFIRPSDALQSGCDMVLFIESYQHR